MARKKIASLLGSDPEYSRTYGIETKAAEPAKQKPKADTVTDPKPEPEPKEAPKPQAEADAPARPEPEPAAEQSTPKPAKRRKPVPPPEPKVEEPSEDPPADAAGGTRAVHVRAAPKADHKPGLDALAAVGLPPGDVVRLAGQRALKDFQLSAEYRPKDKTKRLPATESYRTMKTFDADMLETLRDQADPLRLRSDAFVIQGQLEPIFWTVLDEVIEELRLKYGG